MIRLSSRQYSLLRKMPDEFGTDLARKYNQTTLGSFARRNYVRKSGNKFKLTQQGAAALSEFGKDEIFRKVANDRLSIHFSEVFNFKKVG